MSRTSIVLFGVVLTLVAFIAIFERGTLSTGEREGRKGRVLDNFVRDRVTRIELQRRGQTLVLRRVPPDLSDQFDAGGWNVDQPYNARADQPTVDNLLGALEFFEARRSLGELSAKDREAFGLAHPRYRVAFWVGRDRVAFSVGGAAADGGAYLELQGKSQAFVVGKDFLEVLDHDPVDYHNKELHQGVSIPTLVRLQLHDASGDTSIEPRGGFYWLKTPFESMASEAAVKVVVDGIDALRATRFIAAGAGNATTQYGFAARGFGLRLDSRVFDTKQKNKKVEEKLALEIGAACVGHTGESYLRVDHAAIYCALDADLDKLKKNADQLREARLLPLEDSAIHGVRIVNGASELVVSESGDDVLYRVLDHGRETAKGMVDQVALHDWFKLLRGVTVTRFEPLTAAAPTPSIVATFKQGKDQGDYVLRLSTRDGSDLVATRLDERTLLHVPTAARELLSTSAVRFRKRRVIDDDEALFTKLVLVRADGSSETVTKTPSGYALSGPIDGAAQRSTVDDLTRLTSQLDALRFVSEVATPEQGFAAPHRVLQIEFKHGDGVRTHRLELGAALGDEGRYARVDADPAVFVIPHALDQLLDAPLLSRDAVALPLDALESFELSATQLHLRVERHGETFVVTHGQGNAARAEQLARLLATLHASRVVHYGKAETVEGIERAQLRVAAHLKGGREATLGFGAAVPGDSSQVYLRLSGVDATFQVPQSTLDALLGREPAKSAG